MANGQCSLAIFLRYWIESEREREREREREMMSVTSQVIYSADLRNVYISVGIRPRLLNNIIVKTVEKSSIQISLFCVLLSRYSLVRRVSHHNTSWLSTIIPIGLTESNFLITWQPCLNPYRPLCKATMDRRSKSRVLRLSDGLMDYHLAELCLIIFIELSMKPSHMFLLLPSNKDLHLHLHLHTTFANSNPSTRHLRWPSGSQSRSPNVLSARKMPSRILMERWIKARRLFSKRFK